MRPDRARAGRADRDPRGPDPERDDEVVVEEPADPDVTAADTIWRAGTERVATGPLRAHGTNVYNAEDEPLQEVTDRPTRTTRGRPASDATGLSTADDGDAKTGSRPQDRT
jgi:hypothetical protein